MIPSSELLLSRLKQNEETAFTEAHQRYIQELIRFSERLISSRLSSKLDADDVSQDCFIVFFDKVKKGTVNWVKEGDLWRLLAGIARNIVRKQAEKYGAQKRNLETEKSLGDHPDAQQFGERSYVEDRTELLDLIDGLLLREPKIMRDVFRLRLAGYSNVEMASTLNRSERTCRRLVEVLKAKLRIEFDDLGSGPDWIPSDSNEAGKRVSSIDDLVLLKLVGHGSFGKVYLAKRKIDHEPANYFAVKILRKKWIDDQNVRRLFLEESRLITINVDNIFPRSFGNGILTNGSPFYCLELLPKIWSGLKFASLADLNFYFQQLINLVAKLHSRCLIHGDLTPENVGITRSGHVKLIDLGMVQKSSNEPPNDHKSYSIDIVSLGWILDFSLRKIDIPCDISNRFQEIAKRCIVQGENQIASISELDRQFNCENL